MSDRKIAEQCLLDALGEQAKEILSIAETEEIKSQLKKTTDTAGTSSAEEVIN